MPIINTDSKILRNFFQHLWRLIRPFDLPTWLGRFRIAARGWFLLHCWKGRRPVQIGWIRTPFAFWNFDRHQTSKALLLSRSAQSRIFTSHSDSGRRDWVLGDACSWAAQGSFHGLHIVVMSSAAVVVICMRLAIFSSRSGSSATAFIARMTTTTTGTVPFNSFSLTFATVLFPLGCLGVHLAVALCTTPVIGFSTLWSITTCMGIPRQRCISLILSRLVVHRNGTNDAAQFFYTWVSNQLLSHASRNHHLSPRHCHPCLYPTQVERYMSGSTAHRTL